MGTLLLPPKVTTPIFPFPLSIQQQIDRRNYCKVTTYIFEWQFFSEEKLSPC
jgi:hypothetical protein